MAILKPLDALKTPRECGLKLLEEASEACEAMKEHAKYPGGLTRRKALRELADVLQVMANCLHALKTTPDELEAAIAEVQGHNHERGRHEIEGAGALTVNAWHGGASLADLYGIPGEKAADD